MDSNIELIVINSDKKEKEYINVDTRLNQISSQFISICNYRMDFSDKGELKDLFKEIEVLSQTNSILNLGNKYSDNDIIYKLIDNIEVATKKIINKITYCPFEVNHSFVNGKHSFKIDHNFIFAFNLIIIQIFEKMSHEEIILKIKDLKAKNLAFTNDTSNWNGKKSNLSFMKDIFQCVTIETAFSDKNSIILQQQQKQQQSSSSYELLEDKSFVYSSLLFFFLFFPHVFSNVEKAVVDLNIYQLITIYSKIANPYKFDFYEMGSKYDDILLANYFFTLQLRKMEKVTQLQIIANESYVIENQTLKQKKDSLCFLELIQLNQLNELLIEINSLDSLVFKHTIDLLISNKNLERLSIDLFLNQPVYLRKLYYNASLLNNTNYNVLDSEKSEDQYIDYRYITNLSDSNQRIISKEKLPKYLFKGFNDNLRNLILVLETLTRSLKSLHLILDSYSELNQYDSYNSSLTCFLFNIMLILNEKINDKLLEEIKIIFNGENYHFFMDNLLKEYSLHNSKFSLNLPALKIIHLSIPYLSTFISFEHFPYESLKTLILNKFSYEDFCLLVPIMKQANQRMRMKKMKRIEIELEYCDKINNDLLSDFLQGCLGKKLTYCLLDIPWEIQLSTMAKMIKSIMTYMTCVDNERSGKITIELYCHIQQMRIYEGDHKNICNKAYPQMRKFLSNRNITSYRCYIPLKSFFQFTLYRLIKEKIDYNVLYTLDNLFRKSKALNLTLNVKERIFRNVFYFLNAKQLKLNIYMKK